MDVKRIISLFFLLGLLFLSACSGENTSSPRIESGSMNQTYQGNPLPHVEKIYKITEAQQRVFESLIQKDVQSGGGESGTKPNI